MSEKMDAAGRLLAAEAEYLRACGWVPASVMGASPPKNIIWRRPPDSVHVDQETAIGFQKIEDHWPEVKT